MLIQKYKIKKRNIVGHSDISPLRKKDPGEKFPWKELAKKNIGIWHNYRSNFIKKFRKIKITKFPILINFTGWVFNDLRHLLRGATDATLNIFWIVFSLIFPS